jgi:hypothetical protein
MRLREAPAGAATPGDAPATGEADPAEAVVGCPLHFAMARLAELAVRQHVLYEEGEYAPRADLLRRLEQWTLLHRLIAMRVCPASRQAPLELCRLDAALRGLAEPTRGHLRTALARCSAHGGEDGCPLTSEPRARLLGGADRLTERRLA